MAGSSLLTLLDDIASILDDVSILTKVAAKKTAGVLGDDLALNAQQVAGVHAERELPVVWAVAKGSAINKAILVPAALAISAFAPWAVAPLLMVGGAYLCFEGVEKIAHKLLHDEEGQAHKAELTAALRDPQVDLVALERDKIKGAIRTDFILSAEIITISLGAVADAPLVTRIGVLISVAALMTVGVYGLVAGIVKLDDLGAHLVARGGAGRAVGQAILATAPWLMKSLSIAGTAAMFLVGGGILSHGIPQLAGPLHVLEDAARSLPAIGPVLAPIAKLLADVVLGVVVGGLVLGAVTLVGRLRRRAAA